MSLHHFVHQFPTPTKEDYRRRGPNSSQQGLPEFVNNYPTPNASDATGGPGSSGRDGGPNLRTVVSGQLNPDWTEWLMGWPIGWTGLEPLPRDAWEAWIDGIVAGEWWLSEPDGIPRVATGVKNRVARIKALGNGQVPLCAAEAWRLLSEV